MKLAIMQPYFFPYLGYFEMMNKVDMFMFLTDVQYVRGWINKNTIKFSDDRISYITVPINKSTQKTNIEEKTIAGNEWVDIHLKTFCHAYGNKVAKNEVFNYYNSLKKYTKLCPLLCDSLKWMAKHLGIQTSFNFSSNYPSDLKGQNRIIHLCKKMKATTYVNLSGGKILYDPSEFLKENIKIEFMEEYKGEHLSVLDWCFNEKNSYLRF